MSSKRLPAKPPRKPSPAKPNKLYDDVPKAELARESTLGGAHRSGMTQRRRAVVKLLVALCAGAVLGWATTSWLASMANDQDQIAAAAADTLTLSEFERWFNRKLVAGGYPFDPPEMDAIAARASLRDLYTQILMVITTPGAAEPRWDITTLLPPSMRETAMEMEEALRQAEEQAGIDFDAEVEARLQDALSDLGVPEEDAATYRRILREQIERNLRIELFGEEFAEAGDVNNVIHIQLDADGSTAEGVATATKLVPLLAAFAAAMFTATVVVGGGPGLGWTLRKLGMRVIIGVALMLTALLWVVPKFLIGSPYPLTDQGLVAHLLRSALTHDLSSYIYALVGAVIVYVFGMVLYQTRQPQRRRPGSVKR